MNDGALTSAPVAMGQGAGGSSSVAVGQGAGESHVQGMPDSQGGAAGQQLDGVGTEAQTTTTTTMPDDWTQSEAFRKFQSDYDGKVSAAQRQAQEFQTQLQQSQQYYEGELSTLRNQFETVATKGMDDFEKTQFERDQALRRAEGAEAQFRQYQQEQEKQRALIGLSELSGMPIDQLPATSYVEAAQASMQFMREKMAEMEKKLGTHTAQLSADRAGEAEARTTDVGGGAPVTPIADIQRRWNEAMVGGQVALADDIAHEAINAGTFEQLDRQSWVKMRK